MCIVNSDGHLFLLNPCLNSLVEAAYNLAEVKNYLWGPSPPRTQIASIKGVSIKGVYFIRKVNLKGVIVIFQVLHSLLVIIFASIF